MRYILVFLAIAAPTLGIIYATLQHFYIIDKITGLSHAKAGLARLKKTSGYPNSWIYNDETDKKHFKHLFKIIKANTSNDKLLAVLKDKHIPTLITTGGEPIPIYGIPEYLSQEERFTYSDNHPVLLIFNVERGSKEGKGKGEIVGTLDDIAKWISRKQKKNDYIVGGILLGLILIAFSYWQIKISMSSNPEL